MDDEEIEMQLQMGKKTLPQIKTLIDSNCWKATAWIHSLLLRQLRFIFYYYGIKQEPKGRNHKKNWEIVEKQLYYLSQAIELCHSRNLVSKEYSDLIKFKKFRNIEIGHPDIYQWLVEDNEVKTHCKLGLKLVKNLDGKIHNMRHNPTNYEGDNNVPNETTG